MVRRTKEEAALTRHQILKAALSVFGAKGYSATTLQEIAREAGVTRGAIYWHFDNKAELYNALIETYSARGATVTRQAVAQGGSLVDILRRIFIRLLEAVEEEPDLRAIMEIHLFKTGLSRDLQPGRERQVQAAETLLSGIAEAMRRGIATGELRDDLQPEEMARAFLALQNGAIYLWLMNPLSFSLRQSAESLVEIFIGGIVAQKT